MAGGPNSRCTSDQSHRGKIKRRSLLHHRARSVISHPTIRTTLHGLSWLRPLVGIASNCTFCPTSGRLSQRQLAEAFNLVCISPPYFRRTASSSPLRLLTTISAAERLDVRGTPRTATVEMLTESHVAALLLLLVWMVVPFVGLFVWCRAQTCRQRWFLAAPVSLVQAVRATEPQPREEACVSMSAPAGRPWGYVLVVERQDDSRRFWVDPNTGEVEPRNGRPV